MALRSWGTCRRPPEIKPSLSYAAERFGFGLCPLQTSGSFTLFGALTRKHSLLGIQSADPEGLWALEVQGAGILGLERDCPQHWDSASRSIRVAHPCSWLPVHLPVAVLSAEQDGYFKRAADSRRGSKTGISFLHRRFRDPERAESSLYQESLPRSLPPLCCPLPGFPDHPLSACLLTVPEEQGMLG